MFSDEEINAYSCDLVKVLWQRRSDGIIRYGRRKSSQASRKPVERKYRPAEL